MPTPAHDAEAGPWQVAVRVSAHDRGLDRWGQPLARSRPHLTAYGTINGLVFGIASSVALSRFK
jgi:hypothetical protein